MTQMHQDNKHPNRLPAWSLVLLLTMTTIPAISAQEPIDLEQTAEFAAETAGLQRTELPGTPFSPTIPKPSLGATTMTHTSFSDNFNDGTPDTAKWSYLGAAEGNGCGYVSSPNALRLDGAGSRSLTTVTLSATGASSISFYVMSPSAATETSTCENPDPGENLQLQYSTNGGTSWTTMTTYSAGTSYTSFTAQSISVPSGAKTSSTMFRWYQASSSGPSFDHWAIDDVTITGAYPTGGSADTTPPTQPTVSSTSHTGTTTWYNNNAFSATFASSDSGSGVYGYSYAVDSVPDCVADTTASSTTVYNVANGAHVFYVRAIDNAGNCGSYASRAFRVDVAKPTINGLSSSSHPGNSASSWYNQKDIYATASGSDSGGSGFAGFSYIWTTGSSVPECSKTPTNGAFTSGTSFSKLGVDFGAYKLRVMAVDNAGNCSTYSQIATSVDSVDPTFDLQRPLPNSQAGPKDSIQVEYSDKDGGSDLNQITKVNVGAVKLFIDGVDRTAEASKSTGDLSYTPQGAGWTAGPHTVEVRIADQSIGANTVVASWSFTSNPLAAGDGDGDLVPDLVESTICKTLENEGTDLDGDCNDEKTDYTPPVAGLDALERLTNDLNDYIRGIQQKSPVKINVNLFN